MSKLKWDELNDRIYESGVDHGVLYVKGDDGSYGDGVVWNGLISVSESPEGGEPNPLYADNIKYLNLVGTEEFNYSIEAYTYPPEFEACEGNFTDAVAGLSITGQTKKEFGFCYRTKIGTANNQNAGYKLHIVYGCLAAPSDKGYETQDNDPDAITFSWDVSTTPVNFEYTVGSGSDIKTVTGSTAHLEINSIDADDDNLAALEALLYGTDPTTESTSGTPASLPSIETIIGTLKGTT